MADTIADKIQNKKVAIIAAYSKCSEKGATLPESQIIANLAECIDTIELPPVYTGEYNITSNKELQVAGMKMKSNLNVDVPVPSGYYKLQTYHGTYTPANDTTDKSFTFDFVPKGIAIITRTSIARAATYSYIGSWVWMDGVDPIQAVNYVINTNNTSGVNGATQGGGTGSFPTTLSGKTFTFKLSATTTTGFNFRFKKGARYHIYAWGY